MAEGFVYILINPSMEGQVKIGLTSASSEERASQLSSASGVPTPFVVVYDELVNDCEEVEKRLHARFQGYRVSRNREFFRIPIKDAIKALQMECAAFKVPAEALRNRVEILPGLRRSFASYLKPDLVSIAIVQLPDVCFLETVRRTIPHLRDEITERIDLSFIYSNEAPMFPIYRSAEQNAETFLSKMDPISIINCTNLFTDEAARRADEEWRQTQSHTPRS